MRLIDVQGPQHRDDVVRGTILRIGLGIGGYVGRGKAAGGIGDAPVAPREVPHLRLPAPIIATEFVEEDDGRAGAALLVIEIHAVVGDDLRQGSDSSMRQRGAAILQTRSLYRRMTVAAMPSG